MNKVYRYLDSECITYLGNFDEKEGSYYGALEWDDNIIGTILFHGIGEDTIELTDFRISKTLRKLLEQDSIDVLGISLG